VSTVRADVPRDRRNSRNQPVRRLQPQSGRTRLQSTSVVLGRFTPLLAAGLLTVLDRRDFTILARDVEDADLAGVISRVAPHIAILDEASATDHLPLLMPLCPRTIIAILAEPPATPTIVGLIAAGVTCLSKRIAVGELRAALLGAVRGLDRVGQEDFWVPPTQRAAIASLTSRETEVLGCLEKHMSNAEIAETLQIATETVRAHTKNVFRKFNVGGRRELLQLRRDGAKASPYCQSPQKG
jgi:DNA-binding CsgD family transcriptional regulator